MGPTYARIRAFNAVVREGGFSKAAIALGVSQPAVTAQIRRLESDYGRLLFERLGNGARPTALGRQLYRITQRIHDIEDAADALLRGDDGLEGQELKVATASPQVFMPLLAGFQKQHPQISMEITLGSTGEVIDRVLNRHADVGLTPTLAQDERLDTLPFTSHHPVLLVPQSTTWERRDTISLAELHGEPIIFRTGSSMTQRLVDALLADHGMQPTPSLRLATREAMQEAVANGLGLAFVLYRDAPPDPRLKTVELREPTEEVWEHVVWLKHRSNVPIVREFISMAEADIVYSSISKRDTPDRLG